MGKDKTIQASSEEFVRNENKALRKKLAEKDAELAFANETIKKLQTQCSRMSKWASEIEANAQDKLEKKSAESENRLRAMGRMAEEIYGL